MKSIYDTRKFNFRLTDAERAEVERQLNWAGVEAKRLYLNQKELRKISWNDVLQFAFLCCCLAVKSWDGRKGAMTTWVSFILRRNMSLYASEAANVIAVPPWLFRGDRREGSEASRASAALVRHSRLHRTFPDTTFDRPRQCPVSEGQRDEIGRMIDGLPAEDQVAVREHALEGKCFSEIGKGLGITKEGARQRFKRGSARLRRRMENSPSLFTLS